jgi:hypothetical protein
MVEMNFGITSVFCYVQHEIFWIYVIMRTLHSPSEVTVYRLQAFVITESSMIH